MWIRKTNTELLEEKNVPYKFSFKPPLIIFFVVLLLTVFGDIVGQSAISTWKPKSLIEIINSPIKYLIWSIGSFFVTSVYQLWNKRNLFQSDNKTLICDKCFNTKNHDGKLECNCGGEYISIKKMKWVDE